MSDLTWILLVCLQVGFTIYEKKVFFIKLLNYSSDGSTLTLLQSQGGGPGTV